MARVSELDRAALPDDLQPLWSAFTSGNRDFTNQARVLAHSPDAFRHLYGLIEAMRASSGLPPRLVEIAVVTASRANACPYCVGHHGAALVSQGLSPETVERILEPDVPGLTAKERLVRDYARLLCERAWGIGDRVFADLAEHFSDREIVELTIRVGLCTLFNRFNQALQIDAEDSLLAALGSIGLSAGDDITGGKPEADEVADGEAE